jgi:hypothetical protein
MIPPKLLRKKVLEALNMAKGFGKNEAMLREMVKSLTREDPGLQALRDGMERLLQDALIRSEDDTDDGVLWYITDSGIAHLNII